MVDAQTFLIPNFTYDGQAPDAHFWVGQGKRPGPEVIDYKLNFNVTSIINSLIINFLV